MFSTSGVIGHRTYSSLSDVYFKFEEDRTKTAVAIVDDRYFGQTDRQTDIRSCDFISVQCHALHSTDTNYMIPTYIRHLQVLLACLEDTAREVLEVLSVTQGQQALQFR